MREFKDWSYFEFDVGRYLPWGWEWNREEEKDFKPYKPNSVNTTKNKLTWYVFNEDRNGEIIPVDIFQYNWVFLVNLVKIKRKYGDDFIKFADATRTALQHEYWSRSEYETIITSWPPYIDEEELQNLIKEREEHTKKYPNSKLYRQSVGLTVGKKIDVYDQLMLNWDAFINYVWTNKHLITPKKLGIEECMKRR